MTESYKCSSHPVNSDIAKLKFYEKGELNIETRAKTELQGIAAGPQASGLSAKKVGTDTKWKLESGKDKNIGSVLSSRLLLRVE